MNIPDKCKECQYMKNFVYGSKKKPTPTCLYKLFRKDEGKECAKDDERGGGAEAV